MFRNSTKCSDFGRELVTGRQATSLIYCRIIESSTGVIVVVIVIVVIVSNKRITMLPSQLWWMESWNGGMVLTWNIGKGSNIGSSHLVSLWKTFLGGQCKCKCRRRGRQWSSWRIIIFYFKTHVTCQAIGNLLDLTVNRDVGCNQTVPTGRIVSNPIASVEKSNYTGILAKRFELCLGIIEMPTTDTTFDMWISWWDIHTILS